MHRSRRVLAASISVSLALATSVAVAHADASSVLYVNNATSANCIDTGSGAGSAATPFCTIQAAADEVTAGETVEIAAGKYQGPVTVTSAGTASAPIVFQATGFVSLTDAAGVTAPALDIHGSSYVTFEGADGPGRSQQFGIGSSSVVIDASSHVTLDSVEVLGASAQASEVEVTGSSSDVSITRSLLEGFHGGVQVDSGSSGDVISTNVIESPDFGIALDGASDTAITSNTVAFENAVDGQIGVTDSTGTSIEDNIVAYPIGTGGSDAAIEVDASSAPDTTEDYNVVWPAPQSSGARAAESAYVWAGVTYSSVSAFHTGTAQGGHDLLADPALSSLSANTITAPQVNSANSSASGMLDTDIYGQPCAANPEVPITGAGSPAYCARGAVQQKYNAKVVAFATAPDALGVTLDTSMSETSVDGLGTSHPVNLAATPAVRYVVDWGDLSASASVSGSSTNILTFATHTYATPGTYTITDTAELTDGSTAVTTTTITTAGSDYTPFGPTRILNTENGTGAPQAKVPVGGSITVPVAGVDSIPTNISAVALNLTVTGATGNGYLSVVEPDVSNLNYGAGQTLANAVIAPVFNGSVTIYNTGTSGATEILADVSGYFTQTAGDGYAAVPLDRILNTRNGTGARQATVPANTGIPVTVAGVDSIPADVKAVAVHVTVTDTTGNGWIAAEPATPGIPTTSTLNYGNDQIVSNTVIVPVAADGKIELYNGGGTTPVDLLADVSGYFTTDAPDAYEPINPQRVVTDATVPFQTTTPESLSDPNFSVPTDAILATNTTVTDTKGTGYIIVYPAGTNQPATSNLNFTAGQTLAGFGILSTSGDSQEVEVCNGSTGSLEILFDVFGYFSNS